MKTKTICYILFALLTIKLSAQKNLEKGDKYFFQNQFAEAAKCYQLEVKNRNKKVAEKAMLGLADCYRISGEFEKAEVAYKKFLKKFKKNPLSYLNYGLSLKSSAKYAEAKVQFEEYIKMNPADQMGPVYLQSCDSAQLWLDETLGKEVKNIAQINTEHADFSPYLVKGDLYFSSAREGSKSALISFDGGSNVSRMDIYHLNFSDLLKTELNKKAVNNEKFINTPAHEGAPTLSADGNEMYFCRTVKGERDKKTNDILKVLQIFYSSKDTLGNWSVPVSAFSFNSFNYSVAHPSLSKDGNTIFFASDMPGGFGKTDIYYCTKIDSGKWSKPVNAGNKVNTFGHELFPFIGEAGELYFSSSAHPGMGQLDIFKAQYVGRAWTDVKNLKPPINSIGNDFGICLDASGARGLFSSDRFNGKGGEDIYSFANETPLVLNIVDEGVFIENTFVFDELKFKLFNKSDSVEIELPQSNQFISFLMEKEKTIELSVRKNGMVINKIELLRTLSSADSTIRYEVISESLPVIVKRKNEGQQKTYNVKILDQQGAFLSEYPLKSDGECVLRPSEKAMINVFLVP